MSRIPTFETKLKHKKHPADEIRQVRRSLSTECIPSSLKIGRNQTVDKVPELPVIKRPAKINLRRSKSFSDIRAPPNKTTHLTISAGTSRYVPNVKTTQNGNPNMTKSGSTTSKSNVARPYIKPNIAKPGTKRAGGTCESESKNKILKISKVPNWDYKKRFCILQEKFNILQEDYNTAQNCVKDVKATLEAKISELEKSQEAWKALSTCNDDLKNKLQQISYQFDSLKNESSLLRSKYDHYFEQTQSLLIEKEHLLNEVFNGEKLRRKLHNTIQDLKGNIRVFCRLRPPLNELEKISMCNFNFSKDNCIEISKIRQSIASAAGIKGSEPQEFTFDKVFNQEATQEAIFEELSQLVQSAMDGYHVCVVAYGQTGSGKTYTMQGESDPIESLGMIPRSAQLIFERIQEMQKIGWSYKIQASFLEIYNETIRDLLNMKSGKNLDIRFNEGKGTTVSNLTVMPISSADELMQYMCKAQQNRSTAVTNYNEHSSRSHAVTKIYLEARYQDSDEVYAGSVSLVDLAGSESAKSVSNARLAETKNINKSLSSLGNVMMALYKKESHIPYRNSKLTFLLQSSLGGNCKCLMIVNISPLNDSYNESVNALRFAAKVKEVKIASSKNKSFVTPSK